MLPSEDDFIKIPEGGSIYVFYPIPETNIIQLVHVQKLPQYLK